MTTLHLRKSIGRSPSRRGYLLIAVALCCFGLAPAVQAVSPPPDGGYAKANTAEGDNALFSLTTGTANTAVGFQALISNTTGSQNTAIGYAALDRNTTGNNNMANGASALFSNTTGTANTANGSGALAINTTGSNNTANGAFAFQFNTTGNNNTAVGDLALEHNTTGSNNIGLGVSAGMNNTTGNNNIWIGNPGAGEFGHIRIGTQGTQTGAFIAGISGVAITGTAVVVNASGQLGVLPSSARFKDQIKPMDKASEAIFALKPVTFHYNNGIDPNRTAQFGLVAEDVAKVNPSLVTRDDKGEVYTVRYDAVNAMLLNEFLKEHQKVQQLEKQIEKLNAGLQKVSAQLETSKAAPQVVNNP